MVLSVKAGLHCTDDGDVWVSYVCRHMWYAAAERETQESVMTDGSARKQRSPIPCYKQGDQQCQDLKLDSHFGTRLLPGCLKILSKNLLSIFLLIKEEKNMLRSPIIETFNYFFKNQTKTA